MTSFLSILLVCPLAAFAAGVLPPQMQNALSFQMGSGAPATSVEIWTNDLAHNWTWFTNFQATSLTFDGTNWQTPSWNAQWPCMFYAVQLSNSAGLSGWATAPTNQMLRVQMSTAPKLSTFKTVSPIKGAELLMKQKQQGPPMPPRL